MPSLPELQADFARAILARETQAIAASIDGAAHERLAIYRSNVFGNYRSALRAVYPVVLRLVGEGFFRTAAARYAVEHPSGSGDLSDFGAAFPEFLAGYAPAAGLTYLAEVARLEWAVECVFHAADEPPLDIRALAAIPPERLPALRFGMARACALLASSYPVGSIWEMNQPDFEGDDRLDVDSGGERLLVTRPQLEVRIQRLGADEYAWLSALSSGTTLAEAHAGAIERNSLFDLGACLQRHLSNGLFTAVHLD